MPPAWMSDLTLKRTAWLCGPLPAAILICQIRTSASPAPPGAFVSGNSCSHGLRSYVSLSACPAHAFSKAVQLSTRLVRGLGVEGDAHAGTIVKHRKNPAERNLWQVHLLQAELLDELDNGGFVLSPGSIGENILTSGIDLLSLPRGQPPSNRANCDREGHGLSESI
jgi:hypothetical protein